MILLQGWVTTVQSLQSQLCHCTCGTMHLGGICTFWGCTSQGVPSDSIWNSMDGCSFLRGQSSPRLQATVVSTLSAFESKNLFAAKGQMHFQNQNIMDDPTHGHILYYIILYNIILYYIILYYIILYWYFVYTTVYHVIPWSEQFCKSTATYQGHKFMVAGSLKSQIVSVMWRLWKVRGSRKKITQPPNTEGWRTGLQPCRPGAVWVDSSVQWKFRWICILELLGIRCLFLF